MKTIGLLQNLNIVNILDISSAIKFYLEMEKINFPNYFSILISKNSFLEVAIFKEKRKIFKNLYELNSEQNENLINNENKTKINKEFKILNKKHSDKLFCFFIEVIQKAMEDEMGKQDFDIQEIYYFENLKNEMLLKILCFGGIISNNYPILSEYQLILKFLDYNENTNLSKIELSNIEYSISKSEIKLTIEEYIPYKDCFYIAIPLIMKEQKTFERRKVIITIYFNQINYFYASTNLMYVNSQEFIFYKTFPKIKILEYQINYEEKFEENSFYKRINLININLKDLEIEGVEENFLEENINDINDELIIFYSNINIVSIFIKSETIQKRYNLTNKQNAINLLKISNIINTKLSLEEINIKNSQLMASVENLKKNCIINSIKNDYDLWNEDDIILMKSYYKLQLFGQIFYLNKSLNLNDQYNLFLKLFQNLEDFEKKCKRITDKKLEALFFSSACLVLSNIAKDEKKREEVKDQKELLDLIDFSENSIYKDALENNKEFIINLKRSSFIFNYLLQINSPNKINENLIFDYENIGEIRLKTSMISMITIHQLKYGLFKSLPKYAIRLFFDCNNDNDNDKNTTILKTSIILFNEIKLFGKPLSLSDLDSNNDKNYIKRIRLSITIKNEIFWHPKTIFNKNEESYTNSPIAFYNLDSHELIIFQEENEGNFKGKIGESFGNLITNNNRELIIELYNLNNAQMEKLYDNSIWISEANTNLIDELKKITKLETSYKPENILIYNYEKGETNKKYCENNNIEGNDYVQKGTKKYKIRKYKLNQNSINEDKILKLTHTFMKNTLKRLIIKIDKKDHTKKNNN